MYSDVKGKIVKRPRNYLDNRNGTRSDQFIRVIYNSSFVISLLPCEIFYSKDLAYYCLDKGQ